MSAAALICASLVLLAILVVAYFALSGRGAKTAAHSPGSLYDRLGGVFAISAVVDHFSDAVLRSPLVGVNSPNPQLRDWSRRQSAARLPGLKFMRSLWVCDAAGGPLRFHSSTPQKEKPTKLVLQSAGASHLNLANAHRALRITPAEFDEVARLLAASLDHFHVPAREKGEVLGAFLAHKAEVTAGAREIGFAG